MNPPEFNATEEIKTGARSMAIELAIKSALKATKKATIASVASTALQLLEYEIAVGTANPQVPEFWLETLHEMKKALSELAHPHGTDQ